MLIDIFFAFGSILATFAERQNSEEKIRKHLPWYSNYFNLSALCEFPESNSNFKLCLNLFNCNDFIEFGSIQAKFKFEFDSANSHNTERLK